MALLQKTVALGSQKRNGRPTLAGGAAISLWETLRIVRKGPRPSQATATEHTVRFTKARSKLVDNRGPLDGGALSLPLSSIAERYRHTSSVGLAPLRASATTGFTHPPATPRCVPAGTMAHIAAEHVAHVVILAASATVQGKGHSRSNPRPELEELHSRSEFRPLCLSWATCCPVHLSTFPA